jgi:hypothetical protein
MTPEEEQEEKEAFERNPLALKILGDDDKAGFYPICRYIEMVTSEGNHAGVMWLTREKDDPDGTKRYTMAKATNVAYIVFDPKTDLTEDNFFETIMKKKQPEPTVPSGMMLNPFGYQ